MVDAPQIADGLKDAIKAAVVRALRRRAQTQRAIAATGISEAESHGVRVRLTTPESAHALRIAADLEQIAAVVGGMSS